MSDTWQLVGEKAALDSASVKLDAVTVCVSLLHAVASPEKLKTCPLVDPHFLSLEP